MRRLSTAIVIAVLIILVFAPWWTIAQRSQAQATAHSEMQGRYAFRPATIWMGGRDVSTVVRINTETGASWYASSQAEGLVWVSIQEPAGQKAER